MYRILVIDDEPRQRRILSRVIRSFGRAYEVSEAANGQDALRLIKEQHFDIAFCDIRMPLMDGLDFIDEVRKTEASTRFVIVSGYGEFAYAKRAIGLRVSDYILKPIEEEQILQTLLKIENEISLDQQEKVAEMQTQNHLNSMRPVYDEQLLRRWLFGACTLEECNEAQALLPKTRCCLVLALYLSGGMDIQKGGASPVYEILNRFAPPGQVLCIWGRQNRRIAILGMESEHAYAQTVLEIRNCCDKERTLLGMPVVIGIGGNRQMSRQGLTAGIDQAEAALTGMFFEPEKALFCYDEVACRLSGKLQRYPRPDDAIFQIQTAGGNMEAHVNQWLATLIGGKWVQPDVLLGAICNALLQYQHDLLKRLSMADYSEKAPFSSANGIRACASLQETAAFLCRHLGEIQDVISDLGKNRHASAMEDCLMWLEQAFRADISLTSVASRYHFSPSYFSILFKQYTGKSFVDYTAGLRIKWAAQLLENTPMKVYEIALKVGFQDAKYFSRLFKKMQKVTPEEYRRLGAAAKHRLD